MGKLKREIEYLEREMQGIRMTFFKLQQVPIQTLVTARVGSRPKKIIIQQNYNDDGEKGKNQELQHQYLHRPISLCWATNVNRYHIVKENVWRGADPI